MMLHGICGEKKRQSMQVLMLTYNECNRCSYSIGLSADRANCRQSNASCNVLMPTDMNETDAAIASACLHTEQTADKPLHRVQCDDAN
jgi:hypothetical protein